MDMPIEKKCQNCGKKYTTKPGRASRSIACSKPCLGVLQRKLFAGRVTNPHPPKGPDSPSWRGGGHRYWKQFYRDACERCGSTLHLCIHHKDHNRKNNDPSNFETVCKKCHQEHHMVRDPRTGQYTTAEYFG